MDSVEIVKNVCKNRKIPISRLEKDLGFANGYIGQLRKGVLPYERAVLIANYLNLSVEYLLTGKEESSFYADKETDELYESIQNNPDIKFLLSASSKMNQDDLQAVINIVKRMRGIDD